MALEGIELLDRFRILDHLTPGRQSSRLSPILCGTSNLDDFSILNHSTH
jgi:hypothetical protein